MLTVIKSAVLYLDILEESSIETTDYSLGFKISWLEASISRQTDKFIQLYNKLKEYEEDLGFLEHRINYIKYKAKQGVALSEEEVDIFQIIAFLERICLYGGLVYHRDHEGIREDNLLIGKFKYQPWEYADIASSDAIREIGILENIYTQADCNLSTNSIMDIIQHVVSLVIDKDEYLNEQFAFVITNEFGHTDLLIYTPNTAWKYINISEGNVFNPDQFKYPCLEEALNDVFAELINTNESCDLNSDDEGEEPDATIKGSVRLIVRKNLPAKDVLISSIHHHRVLQLSNIEWNEDEIKEQYVNAILQRDTMLVRRLLPCVRPDTLYEGNTLLTHAITHSLPDDLIRLMKQQNPITSVGDMPALVASIYMNNSKLVKLFLDKRDEIFLKAKTEDAHAQAEGLLGFEIALLYADEQIINLLLPLIKDNIEHYLIKTVQAQSWQRAKLLLDYALKRGLNIDYTSIILESLELKDSTFFNKLLAYDERVKFYLRQSDIFTWLATFEDQIANVALTIQRFNIENAVKRKAMITAIEYSRYEMVKFFNEHDPDLKFFRGASRKSALEKIIALVSLPGFKPRICFKILDCLLQNVEQDILDAHIIKPVDKLIIAAYKGRFFEINQDRMISPELLVTIFMTTVYQGHINDVIRILNTEGFTISTVDLKYAFLLAAENEQFTVMDILFKSILARGCTDFAPIIKSVGELENINALRRVIDDYALPVYDRCVPIIITDNVEINAYLLELENSTLVKMQQIYEQLNNEGAKLYLKLNEQFMFLERGLITQEQYELVVQRSLIPDPDLTYLEPTQAAFDYGQTPENEEILLDSLSDDLDYALSFFAQPPESLAPDPLPADLLHLVVEENANNHGNDVADEDANAEDVPNARNPEHDDNPYKRIRR